MKIRLAASLQPDSIVDGEGVRTVLWTQGCPHACPGCQNPGTHDFDGGALFDVSEVIDELKTINEMGLNVWCYTGYTYEAMLKNPKMKKLLSEVDVLVDGKFILEERSLNIYYRGSRNQRVIDVPKSLEQERVVLIDRYMKDKSYDEPYKKPDYMFI